MISAYYAFLAGLLLGAGVFGHALRIVTLKTYRGLPFDSEEFRRDTNRMAIAVAAIVLYSMAGMFATFDSPVACYIAIGGPVLGVTGVLVTGAKIDTFQLVLGIPQVFAAITAILILLGH